MSSPNSARRQPGGLRRLIPDLAGPGREGAVDRIVDLLVRGLPARHPVRRALVDGDLFAPPVLDWGVLAAALLEQAAAGLGPADLDDEPPSVDAILRAVTERLLTAPALSEQEVRQRQADPVDPGLLRLARPDGGQQWPAFQFAPGGGPLPVVRAINTLLNAAGDPIGVTDWWLSRNGWLDGRPSELLGQVPDEVLLNAARAVGSEV